MRGFAALVVAIGHVAHMLGRSVDSFPAPHRYSLAVDLFFVLSGFILDRVYQPRFRQGLSPSGFMVQRYIRLGPMLAMGLGIAVLTMIVRVALHRASPADAWIIATLPPNLLMLPAPNWNDLLFPLNSPGWSLFFELVANLLFVSIHRRLDWRMLTALILGSGAWLVWLSTHGLHLGGWGWSAFVGGFPRVGFSFFVGVAISRLRTERSTITPLAWLITAPMIAIFFIPYVEGWEVGIDLLAILLGMPALVWVGSAIEAPGVRALALLGVISYPLYVLHEPLAMLALSALGILHVMPDRVPFAAGIAGVFAFAAAGWLCDRYYDAPVRKWLAKRLIGRKKVEALEAARPL